MARLALSLAALIPLLGACSDSTDDDCARDAQAGFESRQPFDARARVRRVDCGFTSGVQGLGVAADGSTWLRRSEFKDHGEETFYYPAVKVLTHVGAGGEFLGELTLPDFVQDFVVHPSGELTVFGWEKADAKTALQLRRLSPDGTVIAERVLRNEVPPEERLEYEATVDGRVTKVELPESERYLSTLASRPVGEDAYLLAGMDGLRLLRLGSRLETQWVSVVEPNVALKAATWDEMHAMGAPFIGFALDVDEAGRAHVATPLLDVQRRAYAEALRRLPDGPQARGVLMSSFESTGTWRGARLVPTESADEVVGLVARGGAFAVGASASAPVERADKGSDFNLFFASGRLDRPAEEYVTRDFSLDQDEAPTALVPCGTERYCLAGHTGYVQLDNGRTQDNGKGFVLALDASGAQQDLLLLEGQRDTQVLRATAGPGGSVVFAFSTNEAANTARVADHLKNNEVWLGVYGGP
ncbi:hypothetical protein JY651_13170 [Pyxidicoccus parkwayensis]|uniref:Lipoprotein n=1 Tax=Pyxidicoccus parkwayensis TaxID=2813578 RepID=A0ABX7P5W3_9BACT|nr:hypothetical protein [Pyxidicoccus parkwaysis]QSQ25815.1 hypothetical protein JY651_13170 [Pyxidicoccus parkwaysis]